MGGKGNIMPIAGALILSASVGLLLLPYFRWRFKYSAVSHLVTVYIPKAGRYTFYVRRNRSWTAQGYRHRVKFSISIFDARDDASIISSHNMSAPSRIGVGLDIHKAAYFNAPYPGKFIIKTLPDCRLGDRDKITIRISTNRAMRAVALFGILISPHMFTSGLSGGLISLGGFLVGLVLLGLSW